MTRGQSSQLFLSHKLGKWLHYSVRIQEPRKHTTWVSAETEFVDQSSPTYFSIEIAWVHKTHTDPSFFLILQGQYSTPVN